MPDQKKLIQSNIAFKILYMAVTISLGFFLIHRKIVFSPDSYSYSNWSDLLIKYNFNYLFLIKNSTFPVPLQFYGLWLTIVAFLKLCLKSYWGYGIVTLNYLSACFMIYLLFQIILEATNNIFVLIITAGLLMISIDFSTWISYVLSDTTFAALVFVIHYRICKSGFNTKLEMKPCLMTLVLVVIAMFYRPTAFPLLLCFITCYFLWIIKVKENRFYFYIFILLLFVALILFTLLFSYAVQDPGRIFGSHVPAYFLATSNQMHLGMVVKSRPSTYMIMPHTLADFFILTVKRMLYFYAIYVGDYKTIIGYSFTHKIINTIFFVPCYFFTIIAIIHVFLKKEICTFPLWWSTVSGFLLLIYYTAYHSYTLIDYDHRYRLPIIMPLLFLTAIGMHYCYEYITQYIKNAK